MLEDVLSATTAFYDAFEGRSLEAMRLVWERSEGSCACILVGRSSAAGPPWRSVGVGSSTGRGRYQFIVTNDAASLQGDVAWVTPDENLVDRAATSRRCLTRAV